MVRKRYLTFGPSKKSMKRIREKIHGITHARNGLLTVEKVVERLNKLTKGWGGVLLGRLSVQGISCGERLRASAHGAVPQQEEPAVLPAEIRGHILR